MNTEYFLANIFIIQSFQLFTYFNYRNMQYSITIYIAEIDKTLYIATDPIISPKWCWKFMIWFYLI
jgi:hypothetical protein